MSESLSECLSVGGFREVSVDVFVCSSVCTWVSVSLGVFIPLFIQPLSTVARSQARYWTSGGGLSLPLITSTVWWDVGSKQKSFPEKRSPSADRGIHAMRTEHRGTEHREPEPLKPGT